MTAALNLERFRRELLITRMSLYRLAAASGVHKKTLQRWRTGRAERVRISTLTPVARVMGLAVGDLTLD